MKWFIDLEEQEFETTYEKLDMKIKLKPSNNVISLEIQSICGIKDCGAYRTVYIGNHRVCVKETINEIKEKISEVDR